MMTDSLRSCTPSSAIDLGLTFFALLWQSIPFEQIETNLPVVIAVQKGINEPRYASLPNIMKAKKKEIKVYSLAELGVTLEDQKVKFKHFELPPPKPPGKKIDGDCATQAKELARLLREEAKVI